MLYLVKMTLSLPPDLDEELLARLRRDERERALEVQREGRWPHLWRVAGRTENYSVFDVGDHEELHAILASLPLFPYMDVTVTPLCQHPSSLAAAAG